MRRVRRLGREPLLYLYDVHPDARNATRGSCGLRDDRRRRDRGHRGRRSDAARRRLPAAQAVPVAELAGPMAADPGGQRSTDRPAADRRGPLRRQYWVLDGHNRVAAALYAGAVGIDANVVELVPLGGQPSERPGDLAAVLTGSLALRAAGEGKRPGTHAHEDEIDLPPETA